jgi:hypothetical protein
VVRTAEQAPLAVMRLAVVFPWDQPVAPNLLAEDVVRPIPCVAWKMGKGLVVLWGSFVVKRSAVTGISVSISDIAEAAVMTKFSYKHWF